MSQAFPLTAFLLDSLFFATRAPPGHEDLAQWARLLGIVHLFSMSGLHLYAFLSLIEWIGRSLGKFLRIRASLFTRTGFVLALAVWVVLWKMQDYRVGMLKPLLLVTLRTFGRASGLRFVRFAPLVIAVTFGIFASIGVGSGVRGSLIYFLAVAGGVLGKTHLEMAVYSWLMVVPLDLWEHRGVSLLTPVMSLLSIPLVTAVVIPAKLGEWLGADVSWIWALTERALESLFRFGETFGNLWACPLWASSLGFGMALVVSFFGLGHYRKTLALLVILIAFVVRVLPSREPIGAGAEVVQLDVGQGDSAVVRWSDGSGALIDAGPRRALDRAGWLTKFLRYGVTRLRGVLLTHGDADHVGGLPAVRRVIREQGGVLPLRVAAASGGTAGNAHMSGVVVPLSAGGAYVNLGDANADQEKRFLPYLRSQLQTHPCAVLKVSHHGSKTSSSPELFELCRGGDAWISVGRRNPYGHPHPSVLRRLRDFGIPFRSTADEGDLESTKSGADRRQPPSRRP